MKEFLLQATPTQILLGMYQFEGNKTISIPLFLKVYNTWLELDDVTADIELAVMVTKKVPPEYYTWKELKDEPGAWAFAASIEARTSLKEWANKILA
jgi:hypothetical protein